MHSHHEHAEGSASASAAEPSDLETARAVLAQEEQRRRQACAEELQAVLAKYDLILDVTPAQIVLAPRA